MRDGLNHSESSTGGKHGALLSDNSTGLDAGTLAGSSYLKISRLSVLVSERLHRISELDPQIKLLLSLIERAASPSVSSEFADQLRNPRSISSGVIEGYLRWVAFRDLKPPPVDQSENDRVAEFEPALQSVSVVGLVDGLMERILRVGEPIEQDLAEGLIRLFSGAAERIQFRASTFMLNGSIAKLVESERHVSDPSLMSQQISEAVRQLLSLDGGTFIGFQPPKTAMLPAESSNASELSLSLSSNQLLHRQAQASLESIRSQSACANEVLSAMESRLVELKRQDPEKFERSLEIYSGYRSLLTFSSHLVWQFRGSIDRLMHVAFEVGDDALNERVMDYIMNKSRPLMALSRESSMPLAPRGRSVRDVFVAINNLLSAGGEIPRDGLLAVMDTLGQLSEYRNVHHIPPGFLDECYHRILLLRRSISPDLGELLEALADHNKKFVPVKLSGYKFEVAVGDVSIAGRSEKVLKITLPQTNLVDDTELENILWVVQSVAEQIGFGSLEIVGVDGNLDQQFLRSLDSFEEVKGFNDRFDSSTFLKRFRQERGSFSQYLAAEFQRQRKIDLSPESRLLGVALDTVRPQIGGKALGLEVLRKLSDKFGDERVVVPFHRVFGGAEVITGVLPLLKSGPVIIRSNAYFEYGSPPGLLASRRIDPGSNAESLISSYLTSLSANALFYESQFSLGQQSGMKFLVQSYLDLRASGVIYSSFDGSPDDPVIIEGSIGPCVSATEGLENLVHYRVHGDDIEVDCNFLGDAPQILFHGGACHLGPEALDLSHRELEIYRGVTKDIRSVRNQDLRTLWLESCAESINGVPSPFSKESLLIVSQFAKYVENALRKPVKLEFGVTIDGSIAVWQLDPALIAVGNHIAAPPLNVGKSSISFRTPFTNMPLVGQGLHIVYESPHGASVPKGEPFVVVSMTTPLNFNFEADIVRSYPNCRAVISPSGSRVNHCNSQARTYFPVIGVPELREKLFAKDDFRIGYDPSLRLDINSDGREAYLTFKKVR